MRKQIYKKKRIPTEKEEKGKAVLDENVGYVADASARQHFHLFFRRAHEEKTRREEKLDNK